MPWTEAAVPDLSTKTILITGANTGIGYHAAAFFAARGATVVLACRTPHKMAAAVASIRQQTPTANLLPLQLDLSDLHSVRAFASAFKSTGLTSIDVLLLNAGVITPKYTTTPQGLELMFATNHLGHWLLTGMLLEYIKDVPDSRIIAVSSLGHKNASAISYDLMKGLNPAEFSYLPVYCQTKLANHCFVKVLNQKLIAANAHTIAVAAHPGGSSTDLNRHAGKDWLSWIMVTLFIDPFTQPAAHGAWPLIMAATDPHVAHENYYGPSRWFEMSGPPISNASVNKLVHDQGKADELWRVSEQLCEFTYQV